jgi:two-component system, OmpR family, response regulator ChvI
MKGRYTRLSSNLDESYLDSCIVAFIACKKYDETVTVINTSKHNDVYRKQQLVKHDKRIKRILVVDDEYDTKLTLKVVLEESGFEVDSYTDPEAALRNFKTGQYDLALIDMRMPVMDGFGLYDEIRKLDNKFKICFLTAAEDTYYETFMKQAYPNRDENCILRKPIENELLIKQIKSII